MAIKKKVCKNCGHLTDEATCPLCLSNAFTEKYKGKVLIFKQSESIVAEKLNLKANGMFAIKFN